LCSGTRTLPLLWQRAATLAGHRERGRWEDCEEAVNEDGLGLGQFAEAEER
jgi:hypothetical protein